MTPNTAFQEVFDRLRTIMLRHAGHLVIVRDRPGDLYIDTDRIMSNKKPLWFGGVQIKKSYVSYHLMPVYIFPPLLDGCSAGFLKRMQGKSCFNFKAVDAAMFEELDRLTKSGVELYESPDFRIE